MKRKAKAKKKRSMVPVVVLLVIGLSIMGYPFFSDFYNQIQYKKINVTFDKGAKEIPRDEIDKRIKLAEYYNDSLLRPNITDPFTRKNHEKGIKEYARMLQIKESIGYVEIPDINQSVPIYAGTNEDVLQTGAGHLEFTSLPIGGKGNHCVITAHSGLPTKKLFTDLKKMKKGDIFFVHNIKEVLAYEVDNIQVIEPTDFKPLMRVKGRDYCTLLTCTPYMINSHRLLVRGERTNYKKAVEKSKSSNMKLYIAIGAALLTILVAILIIYIKKKKGSENKDNVKNKK